MKKVFLPALCVIVLSGCRNDKSQKKNRPLAPWPVVRSDISLEDRSPFQMNAPQLVVMRWFSFWCRLKSDGLHDATPAERQREKQWREGLKASGLPVIRIYNVWGGRTAVLAFLDAACAAVARCPPQKLVAILDSPDSSREDPLLATARKTPVAKEDDRPSDKPEMVYLSFMLATDTSTPASLRMSAGVGSLNLVDGRYRVAVPDEDVVSLVRAACASGRDRFSEVSVTPFGEGRRVVRKDSRGRVRMKKRTKSKTGAGGSRDGAPMGTLIREFPALPLTLQRNRRAKALWTPAGEILGEGFDNIATMDLKDTSWMASPRFSAYGLGVIGRLDCEKLQSGGTGLRFTVVDAVVARGPEANEGKE